MKVLTLFLTTLCIVSQASNVVDSPFKLYLKTNDAEIALTKTLVDVEKFFEPQKQFPKGFNFPRSFTYSTNMATITRKRTFEATQEVIVDAENNRIRFQKHSRVYSNIDTELLVYDFDKMRLLASDPNKGLCL